MGGAIASQLLKSKGLSPPFHKITKEYKSSKIQQLIQQFKNCYANHYKKISSGAACVRFAQHGHILDLSPPPQL